MSAAIFCPHCKLRVRPGREAQEAPRLLDLLVLRGNTTPPRRWSRRRARLPHTVVFWQKANYNKIMARRGRRHESTSGKRPWLAVLLLFTAFCSWAI